MHPRICMYRFCFRALAQQVLGSMGARNNEAGEGDTHVSDVVARPVLSRILLPSAYYTRGLSFFLITVITFVNRQ